MTRLPNNMGIFFSDLTTSLELIVQEERQKEALAPKTWIGRVVVWIKGRLFGTVKLSDKVTNQIFKKINTVFKEQKKKTWLYRWIYWLKQLVISEKQCCLTLENVSGFLKEKYFVDKEVCEPALKFLWSAKEYTCQKDQQKIELLLNEIWGKDFVKKDLTLKIPIDDYKTDELAIKIFDKHPHRTSRSQMKLVPVSFKTPLPLKPKRRSFSEPLFHENKRNKQEILEIIQSLPEKVKKELDSFKKRFYTNINTRVFALTDSVKEENQRSFEVNFEDLEKYLSELGNLLDINCGSSVFFKKNSLDLLKKEQVEFCIKEIYDQITNQCKRILSFKGNGWKRLKKDESCNTFIGNLFVTQITLSNLAKPK